MSKSDLPMHRRTFLLGTAALGAGAAFGTVAGSLPAFADAAPTIPEATVRLACNPYGNHAWVVLAGRKGFLKDVGITLSPPEPKVLLEEQTIPQLENHEIDASTLYLGNVTGAIDKLPNIKPFFIHSYWVGNVTLVANTIVFAGVKTKLRPYAGGVLAYAKGGLEAIDVVSVDVETGREVNRTFVGHAPIDEPMELTGTIASRGDAPGVMWQPTITRMLRIGPA